MRPIELCDRLGRWSSGRGPLYVLLAARMRQLIDDGELPPGVLLPPDRTLAEALAVGRTTVVAAYDLLRSEGRITRRQGSGTRVAGTPTGADDDAPADPIFLGSLETRDDGVLLAICAAPGEPPPELAEAYARMIPELGRITGDIGYYPYGHLSLRSAIAERYTRLGVPTVAEQVLVTNGGQQALSLLAHALVSPGDQVLAEAPTFPGALEVFREEGAVLRGLPVGLAGFEAACRDRRPALAYVIPTYHNPTGSVLPRLDRQRLARAAAAADVPLIEDEVPADLGFPGQTRPTPLAAYGSSVISVGSLSKSIWGGLRIGWVRATAPFITRLARLRAVHDLGGNVPAQLAAAHLVPQLDSLDVGATLQSRHAHLTTLLAQHLPTWTFPTIQGGQVLWIRLPHGDGNSFAQTALRHGIAVLPGAGLDLTAASSTHIRLHFHTPTPTLTESVRRLTTAWHTYQAPTTRPPTRPVIAI
ncbi:PLP-dependent aminotransferase family protein [Kribbella sandramycini]|uniref:DNA-binding transcriptional MocR family regulator n=1 Tax=Kribbella sandramycini TaxID=60450 RepID=A0A7Y4P296_9ACTN|nr:PLP-dependent aminotransferase family protein [Kribbella sandramycini]MBB6566107.1 DNA-binding transcriptional MocR family regulator [Kribbella sandramycini]NOL45107.1 PLP-dependent aminotransferase family protein [Kribbella sandramycini]